MLKKANLRCAVVPWLQERRTIMMTTNMWELLSKNYMKNHKMEPYNIEIIIFVAELNFCRKNVKRLNSDSNKWTRFVHRTVTRARKRRITYRTTRDAFLRRMRIANSRDHLWQECVRWRTHEQIAGWLCGTRAWFFTSLQSLCAVIRAGGKSTLLNPLES